MKIPFFKKKFPFRTVVYMGLMIWGLSSCTVPAKKWPVQDSTLSDGAPPSVPQTTSATSSLSLPQGAHRVRHGKGSKILNRQAELLKTLAETQRTEEGIIVNLKIGELFEPGKTTLKPNIIDEITRIGDILADYPQDRVIVVGHTDNNGSDEEAERLSENQAKAVRTQLLICSIPEKNIMAIGMGKSQPIAPNGTPDGQAQNRRIEIKITAK